MGMTMTQKILAARAGLPEVHAGDLIEAKLDLVMGNDVTTPVAIGVFEKSGFTKVFDPEKIAIILDHYTPCKDIASANLCKTARDFARKHNIRHLPTKQNFAFFFNSKQRTPADKVRQSGPPVVL